MLCLREPSSPVFNFSEVLFNMSNRPYKRQFKLKLTLMTASVHEGGRTSS